MVNVDDIPDPPEPVDDRRTCPHPACSRHVDPSRFACPKHWFGLPKPIRWRIWRGWTAILAGRPGAVDEYTAATFEALEHWRKLDQ